MPDFYMVERSGTLYKLDGEKMASIEDSDLLIVDRSGTKYKITGSDLKASVGGGNSDEISDITATSSDVQVSFSAYSGNYDYFATAVYVSQSADFTDNTLSFQTGVQDEGVTTISYAGLDYDKTYYVKVSYTDVVGNRRFSNTVQFTSANIPTFAEYIVTQSSGALDLSSYPRGAQVHIAYIASGTQGGNGGQGYAGSQNWNGGGGNGGGSGGFRFFDGRVSDMDGVPLSSLLNNGEGVINLGGTGGGRAGQIYQTQPLCNGSPGTTFDTSAWGVLSEFKGYTFSAGSGGNGGSATGDTNFTGGAINGGQGGGGGGGGLIVGTTGGYDGDNAQPSIPSVPNASNASGGNFGGANGTGGSGFGAGGGGGGGTTPSGTPGTGGSGAAGIAVIKVFFNNATFLNNSMRFIPDSPAEY